MDNILTYIAVFVATALGVAAFRRWSRRRELFDHPNERSSHKHPTPRGGGLVIVAVSLLAFNVWEYFAEGSLSWYFTAGALLVSVISWVDDLRSVSPVARIICHGGAAALVIAGIGGFDEFAVPVLGIFKFGWLGTLLTFVWIIWLINAYNFMDGIDGIAGMQALTAGIGWSLVGMHFGAANTAVLGGVLAASAAGFLIHNWQPARVFMGDVGSAFLGYAFGVMPLLMLGRPGVDDSILPIVSVMLVWFFVMDSVLTFARRLLRGEKVWQAHREHIYQKLVIAGLSHGVVSAIYGIGSVVIVVGLVTAMRLQNSFSVFLFGTIAAESAILLAMWHYRARIAENKYLQYLRH